MAEAAKKSGLNKGMCGLAIVGAGFFLYNLFGGSTQVEPGPQGAPKVVERGSDGVNDIGSIDRDAALAQFRKETESLKEQLQNTELQRRKDREESARQLRELEQKTNTEMRLIAEKLDETNKADVNIAYEAMNKSDAGTDLSLPSDIGLNMDDFGLGSELPPTGNQGSPFNRYGPGYVVLNPNRQGYSGKPAGGAEMYASESDMLAGITAPDINAFSNAAAESDRNMTQAMDQLHGRAPSQASSTQTSQPNDGTSAQPVETREIYKIPAFSYVEVTTLHGVACPVGANSPNNSSSNGDSGTPNARPIVLPVRGVFRGPNGAERDLGTIHLMGLCSGNRNSSSSTGRATIRIEQLSYWDEFGVPQHVKAVGYIVDNRDNQQDVYGRLDQANGRTMALQSAAAAAAAYASTLSQSEFTTSTTLNDNGGTNNQTMLTGDATKAAINQGIAGMFSNIAKRFEAEANAMVDTVIVEPGISLKFITEQEIGVFKAAEPFDIDAGRYDVLI